MKYSGCERDALNIHTSYGSRSTHAQLTLHASWGHIFHLIYPIVSLEHGLNAFKC